MWTPTPLFRDFTRFAVFVIAWQALVESGYGQRQPASAVPPSVMESGTPPVARKGPLSSNDAPAPRNLYGNLLGAADVTAGRLPSAPGTAATLAGLASSVPSPKSASPSRAPGATGSSPRAITQLGGPADPTDPYIVAEAQALNQNPTQIFAFVRDQVGFDPYSGSLRGARGTLWSHAGNALDRASLLIALLEASGFTARYVQGQLTGALAQQILQRIFAANASLGVLGCLPSGTTVANPAADPTLTAIIQQHFWVQFASGAGPFQDADPSFPTSQVGQVFGTPQSTFSSMPDNLKHTVSVELDAETYSSAGALFGLGSSALSTAPVLNVTLATAEITGRSLAFGHLVSSSSSGFVISAQTNSYTPYLLIGGNAPDPSQDETITGTTYQEVFTNFPLGTTVLTGVFLKFQVTDSSGNSQTYNKTLFDLIGYAARRNGTSASISANASSQPSISPLDLTTVNVLPSLQDTSQAQGYGTAVTTIQSQMAPLAAQLATLSAPPTPAQSAALGSLEELSVHATVTLGRLIGASFAVRSDALEAMTAQQAFVKTYFNSPRLIVVTNHITPGQNSTGITQELDLLKDDKASIPMPGQNPAATISYNINHGIMDSVVESQVATAVAQSYTAQNGVTLLAAGSVADIFSAAAAQGIDTVLLTPATAGNLGNLPFSADAKARISDALGNGLYILAPVTPVSINASNKLGWYQFDPATGMTESVAEDGAHQGFVNYVAALEAVALELAETEAEKQVLLFVTGFITGLITGELVSLTVAFSKAYGGQALTLVAQILTKLAEFIEVGSAAFLAFKAGLTAALLVLTISEKKEPEAPAILTAVPVPAAGAPGGSAGVTAQLTPDSLLTIPFSGAELPLVFQAQIQNTGPQSDTFALTPANVPAGFSLTTSIPSITIPAGATALVGVCAVPSGTIPAPGTPESFQLKVASTSNPAINSTASEPFTVPSVQGLQMSLTPQIASATPGGTISATLTAQATGNTAVSAPLSVTVPGTLLVSGVPASVTLNPGQIQTTPITLTVPATDAVGSQIQLQVTASLNANSQTAVASALVEVVAQQAEAAVAGVQDAAALGRNDIATTLSGLAAAINAAVGSCSPASQAEVLAYVNNLIQEMNAPFLASFVSSLQAAQTAIAAATCANIGTALTGLSTVLTSLANALNSPAAYPFSFELSPNSALAIPNQPSQFLVSLQNTSTTTNTYTLSLGTLPAGFSGSLSTNSITLAPGASVPVNNANNNPSVSITPTTGTALQFSVTASINGVAGSGQTAYGTLTARNTFLAVEDVAATPGFTNAGGSVDVVTHIANIVNTNKTVTVKLTVQDASNNIKATVTQPAVQLSVQSLLTTVDFGQINTTGYANGNYSLVVAVIDPVTNLTLPGGTGTGTLLVGQPVTATLTASPQTLAPGNGTVTSTLNVSTTNGTNGNTPFSLIGSLPTASQAESVAVNGTTVYSCDENEVSVINASDPTHPTLAGTAFAGAISNAATFSCDIQRGDLVMFVDTGNSGFGNSPSFIAFDLTNPTSPSLIASTVVNRRFFTTPYYEGNTAFFATQAIFISGSNITGQAGDFASLDITNFNNPSVLGTLETPVPANQPQYGGAFNIFGVTPYSSQLAYAASTTSQGVPNGTGTGQLWVINTSNPASLSLVTQVNVPNTVQLAGPLVQGNTAVAIADTGGWQNPFVTGAFAGTVTIAVFDTTNPQNPQLVANVPTTFLPGNSFGHGSAVIGPHLFLYSGIIDASNNNYLMLVDTTNPATPVITTYPVAQGINAMRALGTLLYAPTAGGLQIYSIPGTGAIQYTAAIQIAKNATVSYNANSFSTPPTGTVTGSGFDTVTWVNPPSNSITWTSAVTGIQPGQVVPVDPGGTVNFSVPLGSGTIALPQADVNSGQILALNPSTATVAPGVGAAYLLTVSNPTASAVTYNLSVAGVAPSWVNFEASVTVPASGQVQVPLTLTSQVASVAGTYAFVVTAASGGASGSVQGTVILQGTGSIGTVASSNAYGVSASLIPISAVGGQGTPAPFTLQITNTGNVTDTYTLSITTPLNVTASLAQSSVQVPPGLSNFLQVLLTLTASQGTAPGPINFTVNAVSTTNASVRSSATGTLNVVSNGVSVTLSPPSGPPGTTFALTVTNKGSVSDTFDLALGGPAAAVSTLATAAVTLAPGASQSVNITTTAGSVFALGTAALTGQATSRGNTSVKASATSLVTIAGSKAVSAAFTTPSQTLPTGPAVLLLNVLNTGTLQDSYTATITSVTGHVQASLVGLDGNPTQSITPFYLPGVDQGLLVLNANVTGGGVSTITVQLTSLSNSSIGATATATINGPAQQSAPVASAGSGGTIPPHRIAILNGSASSDPNSPPLTLTYAWSLVTAPTGSSVTTGSIRFPSSPEAVFVPDVAGSYTFKLTVTNSVGSTSSNVTYNAQILAPTAVAGKPQNVKTGGFVFLNGKDSYDPNGLPLTFAWTFGTLPIGSALTAAGLFNASTPKPFFTPDVNGVYTLQLFVSNGTSQSQASLVQITAASGSLPPNARAGADQNAKTLTQTVTLNGSASYDPNTPQLTLGYAWTFRTLPQGSTAQIQNANLAQAQFVPDVAGDFVFNLHVTNSAGASDDTVTVHAFAGYTQSLSSDVPPNAVTGPDQFAVPGTPVSLDGSASSDPDGGPLPLTYNWWFDGRPAGSAASLTGSTQAGPHFTPDLSGYYIARLEASDGFASGFANTLVTAAQKCDADANGIVNQIDIALIMAALGQTAGANDPRDPLAAGMVTSQDLAYCQALLVLPVLPNAGSAPPSLTFTTLVGTNPQSQTLSITSSGAAFSFTLSTDQPWLSVGPASGSTTGNTITVSIITTGLTSPVYQGNVIVTSSGAANSPFKIPVTLNLTNISIAPTAGTPETANTGAQFTVPFQATVTDSNHNPVSGVAVTFTAPTTGASGTFPGNVLIAIATTNGSGVATAPTFVANGTAGSYTVTAVATGAPTAAVFALTNSVPGAAALFGEIASKQGAQNARVWTFQIGNSGSGTAASAQITSIHFTQTSLGTGGSACTPVITSPAAFPLALGDIVAGGSVQAPVTINFTGCANAAQFSLLVQLSANGGTATGSIVRNNEEQ